MYNAFSPNKVEKLCILRPIMHNAMQVTQCIKNWHKPWAYNGIKAWLLTCWLDSADYSINQSINQSGEFL